MSFYFPECNATLQGSSGAVWVNLPTSASFKPANRGCVTGLWVETPANGYENNVTYNILSKAAGYTGGNDGYLRLNQAGTTLTLLWKNASTTYMTTNVTGIPAASRFLVLVIVNAANYHLVVCVPGSAPIVSTVASTTPYTSNFSAVDFWTRFGVGSAATYGHYGPMEEGFFLLGEFPEASNIPDDTLIRNIADGTQDLATLDAQLTGTVAKKWRYRMQQQDDLTDAYGIAGSLAAANNTADKIILSGGPLRPRALRPTPCLALASGVQFATPTVTASATATIKVEGGTYSGITPAKIQARLRKEDGTVLSGFDWTDIDAAPTGGTWAAGQFTSVPMTAGWLTCDFKAVDGGGSQLGDIVSSHGWKGAGFNVLFESQSQGSYLFDTGSGKAIPARLRAQAIHTNTSGTNWRVKKLSDLNANGRIARGMRQFAIEIDTLFPGVPISVSSVGVQGSSLSAWNTGGAFANMWGDFKAFVGLWQPGPLYFIGHSNPTASYETVLGGVIAKATSDVGAFQTNLFAGTARYAGAGAGASHTDSLNAREGARSRVASNPTTDWWAAHPQVVKNDTGDTGPHPMDNDVGQGRHGALLAWGLMGWCRAVEDEPITLTTATKISGGTVVRLGFGPVNPASAVTLNADGGTFTLTGGDTGYPVSYGLTAASGSFPLAGGDINNPIGFGVDAGGGTFAITGGDIGFPVALGLNADGGSYTLTGGGIDHPVGIGMNAEGGVFAFVGGTIGWPLAGGLLAGAGAFAIAGGDIGFPIIGQSGRRAATMAQSRNGGVIGRG